LRRSLTDPPICRDFRRRRRPFRVPENRGVPSSSLVSPFLKSPACGLVLRQCGRWAEEALEGQFCTRGPFRSSYGGWVVKCAGVIVPVWFVWAGLGARVGRRRAVLDQSVGLICGGWLPQVPVSSPAGRRLRTGVAPAVGAADRAFVRAGGLAGARRLPREQSGCRLWLWGGGGGR
jgi:hypothetical protein